MTADPMDRYIAEAAWLLAHPHFEQKPATISEFLGPGYLDIEAKVRPGVKEALEGIFGEEVSGDRIALYEEAMVTGAIGIGKTTFASIALPYMAHWVLCLKDPQDYFNLLPGSRIAFMQMSTSEDQALQVIYSDIKARIEHAEWFVENYPHDPKYTKQIRFPKDVWILPGDSSETTFEGYNILAGILDEMDSHKVTRDKDYAEQGFDTIHSRIASRFTDDAGEGHKGLIICIGQMKKGTGFAAKKYKEMLANPKAHVTRMTIWESLGWQRFTNPDGTRKSFWYDRKRKTIIPTMLVEMVENPDIIEIPEAYRAQFENNPEKALRDLAGIPPETSDPFISLVHKIEGCSARWRLKHNADSPVKLTTPTRVEFEDWFEAKNDPRKRVIHIDMATSGDGDSLGMAMGHVPEMVEIDGELKPYIMIDCLIRLRAAAGQEIILSDVRNLIYRMKFDLGFRIVKTTIDGFQSTDTMQQLRKKRISAEHLSVDRTTLPYEDLREAIYEERIDFPKYMVYLKPGDLKSVDIAYQELSRLTDTGKKIDHPQDGSKDVADAIAGVCYTLMGDRTYRKGVSSGERGQSVNGADWLRKQGVNIDELLRESPIPPSVGGLKAPPISGGGVGVFIPPRLSPRGRD
jgi:hypothetical protein